MIKIMPDNFIVIELLRIKLERLPLRVEIKMTRFRNNIFWIVPLLVTLLDALLACPLGEERKSETRYLLPSCQHTQRDSKGLNLAHLCMKLHSGPAEAVPVIMLHGLTGSKETWSGIFQNIPLLSHRQVCIYDARNHGDSPWNDTFNIDILAEDLKNFMHDRKLGSAILVGHSMGGLTAMKLALQCPQNVERLFIEDISPVNIPKDGTAATISRLKLLKSSLTAIPDDADENAASEAVADYLRKAMNITGDDYPFRKSLLRRRGGVWEWKFNIDAFIKAVEDPDSFLGKMEGQYDGKVTFIYGKASPLKVFDDKDAILKLFPKAEFIGIEGANHKIHGIYPEYLDILIDFLK